MELDGSSRQQKYFAIGLQMWGVGELLDRSVIVEVTVIERHIVSDDGVHSQVVYTICTFLSLPSSQIEGEGRGEYVELSVNAKIMVRMRNSQYRNILWAPGARQREAFTLVACERDSAARAARDQRMQMRLRKQF